MLIAAAVMANRRRAVVREQVQHPNSADVAYLKAPPSYLRAFVKTTVLAGMFRPVEKVSVAKSTCTQRLHYCSGAGPGLLMREPLIVKACKSLLNH